MSNINYKNKYEQLKAKYLSSVDTAWRLGFEAGLKEAQMDNATQQAQQAQQQVAQAQQAPGTAVPEAGSTAAPSASSAPTEETPSEQAPMQPESGSELDQHINRLEELVHKSELSPTDLIKALEEIRLHKEGHLHLSLPQADENTRQSLALQERIVSDVMKGWQEEENRAKKDILSTLGILS